MTDAPHYYENAVHEMCSVQSGGKIVRAGEGCQPTTRHRLGQPCCLIRGRAGCRTGTTKTGLVHRSIGRCDHSEAARFAGGCGFVIAELNASVTPRSDALGSTHTHVLPRNVPLAVPRHRPQDPRGDSLLGHRDSGGDISPPLAPAIAPLSSKDRSVSATE